MDLLKLYEIIRYLSVSEEMYKVLVVCMYPYIITLPLALCMDSWTSKMTWINKELFMWTYLPLSWKGTSKNLWRRDHMNNSKSIWKIWLFAMAQKCIMWSFYWNYESGGWFLELEGKEAATWCIKFSMKWWTFS